MHDDQTENCHRSLRSSIGLHIYIYTKILEVNLFVFAYRLFRRDFSPLDGTFCIGTHSIFPALYVFYVNLGGFYEWVVLIFF